LGWPFEGWDAVFRVPVSARASELEAAIERELSVSKNRTKKLNDLQDKLSGLTKFVTKLVAASAADCPIPPLEEASDKGRTTHRLEEGGYTGEFAVRNEAVKCLKFYSDSD